jgi:Ca2+-binding RTX toxin-like protein
MHSFQPIQTLAAADPAMIAGVTDLLIADLAGGPVLLGVTRPGGGLVSLRIGTSALALQSVLAIAPTGYLPAPMSLSLQTLGGVPGVWISGGYTSRVSGYQLSATGDIGGLITLRGSPSGVLSAVEFATVAGTPVHFAARASESVIRTFMLGPSNRYVELEPVAFGAAGDSRDITALKQITLGGQQHLVALSQESGEVALFRIDAGAGLVQTGGLGMADGFGMARPVAVEAVQIGGIDFLIVAAAGSSTLSVMQVLTDGSLRLVDHVGDTLLTRFQTVQALSVVSASGWVFVLAGGGDDGITLFVLLPDGRLIKTGQIEQALGLALEDVTALTARFNAGGLDVFVGGERPALGWLRVPLPSLLPPQIGTSGPDALIGGAGADLLSGGAGHDVLMGGAGDDILVDGGGRDTLNGGAGADLFVLGRDGAEDRIEDFEPGKDRIDLTSWGRLYSVLDLAITPTASGALLQWRDEVVVLRSATGMPLEAATLRAAIDLDLWRMVPQPFLSDGIWYGTGLPDLIFGSDGDERFIVSPGPDTIDGGAGNDVLDFGELVEDITFDLLAPVQLFDSAKGMVVRGIEGLAGGAGRDLFRGSSGGDTLSGRDGNDKLEGGAGDDLLEGGAGDDILSGGAGADTLSGGEGFDTAVYWDSPFGVLVDLLLPARNTGIAAGDQIAGVEALWGSFHDDGLWGDGDSNEIGGDWGKDTLAGRGGDDRLFGGEGDDVLIGGMGTDLLDGGPGFDLLAYWDMTTPVFVDLARNWASVAGEADHVLNFEAVFGGLGSDVIRGQGAANLLSGGGGDDLLDGRGGHDTLSAGEGRDTLLGGEGNDLLSGGPGEDHFVFASGQDRITDFSASDDWLILDPALAGGLTSVASALSHATLVEGDVYFDFGGGDSLRLEGFSTLALLADRIAFL